MGKNYDRKKYKKPFLISISREILPLHGDTPAAVHGRLIKLIPKEHLENEICQMLVKYMTSGKLLSTVKMTSVIN